VYGPRVTLLEMNLDDILTNDALIRRVQASKTPDELRDAIKNVPGLKVNLDHEVTVEFTPES
jgi:hypothetical protein